MRSKPGEGVAQPANLSPSRARKRTLLRGKSMRRAPFRRPAAGRRFLRPKQISARTRWRRAALADGIADGRGLTSASLGRVGRFGSGLGAFSVGARARSFRKCESGASATKPGDRGCHRSRPSARREGLNPRKSLRDRARHSAPTWSSKKTGRRASAERRRSMRPRTVYSLTSPSTRMF